MAKWQCLKFVWRLQKPQISKIIFTISSQIIKIILLLTPGSRLKKLTIEDVISLFSSFFFSTPPLPSPFSLESVMVGEPLPCWEIFHFGGSSSVLPFVSPLVIVSTCLIAGLPRASASWMQLTESSPSLLPHTLSVYPVPQLFINVNWLIRELTGL